MSKKNGNSIKVQIDEVLKGCLLCSERQSSFSFRFTDGYEGNSPFFGQIMGEAQCFPNMCRSHAGDRVRDRIIDRWKDLGVPSVDALFNPSVTEKRKTQLVHPLPDRLSGRFRFEVHVVKVTGSALGFR